jgi:PhzF family phenazine biosynthesis protein
MVIQTFLLDTFTSSQFKGNPTTVCVAAKGINASLMQELAKELNQPVTAFVVLTDSKLPVLLRYFTSTGEIPACGHATLAAAQVLFDLTGSTSVTFETIEKRLLHARLEQDVIFMTYPRFQAVDYPVSGATQKALGISTFKSIGLCRELDSLFIELDAKTLHTIRPDYKALVQSDPSLKEVLITSVSDDPEFDFLLRSFCPWIGIDEDPVTGSVHSVLAHFWKDRLGKSDLKAYQASERGGEAHVHAYEDHVDLGGQVQPIFKGEITL